jgi:excisionase family DNA binding protein
MTTKQAAEQLGITQSLVRRRIREKQLGADTESTPRGDIYWITPEQLDAYRQSASDLNTERKGKRGRPRRV